ncbi:MAG: GNAT family N-acetyltransferase [Actinomycetota bacterium]|nr:GNAT family N-acetyltransferase [Actinomycetota bacterium]
MDLNLIIKDLSYKQLEKLDFRCLDCGYWFDCNNENFFKGMFAVRSINELTGFLKGKLFEKCTSKNNRKKIISFREYGGKIKAAFIGGKCAGIILAGGYYLFPRIRSFNIYPPDSDSTFLGCIHVISEYRGMGVGKRLLVEIEKELIKEKGKSIESIGKRQSDDMDEDEYWNSPLIPFKFLINNGFYLKKNDPLFPLLRLDLKSFAVDFVKSQLVSDKMTLEKEVGSPIIIKNK